MSEGGCCPPSALGKLDPGDYKPKVTLFTMLFDILKVDTNQLNVDCRYCSVEIGLL
jgi:hypothetical protein